jgi:hypothetical protein
MIKEISHKLVVEILGSGLSYVNTSCIVILGFEKTLFVNPVSGRMADYQCLCPQILLPSSHYYWLNLCFYLFNNVCPYSKNQSIYFLCFPHYPFFTKFIAFFIQQSWEVIYLSNFQMISY